MFKLNKKIFLIKKSYIFWFISSFFYFYQYILRVSISIMECSIRNEFLISAKEFSYLGSAYLYIYALLQVPINILIDCFGVRKIALLSIIVCLLGTLFLITSNSFIQILISRIFIGAGSASSMIIVLKIIYDEFNKGKRGMLIGSTLMIGALAPIIASKYLVKIIEIYGWRQSMFVTLIIGFIVLFLSFLFLPYSKNTINKNFFYLKKYDILKNKKIFLYVLFAIGLYSPLAIIADFWGTTFLAKKYFITIRQSSKLISLIYLGLGIGNLCFTGILEKYNLIIKGIKLYLIGLIIILSIILFGPLISFNILTLLLFSIGVFSSGKTLCFAEIYNLIKEDSSFTLGLVNTINILGSATIQIVIGNLLNIKSFLIKSKLGANLYHTEDYIFSLSFLIFIILLSFFFLFITKRKKLN